MKSRGASTLTVLLCLGAVTGSCAARSTPDGAVSPGADGPAAAAPPPAPSPPVGQPPPLAQPAVDTPASDCELIDQPGDPVRLVGLAEAVEPSRAPTPSNDSERLVFRQLYETLVQVDCKGRARQGLAAAWRLDADGRTWIMTLREGASFSDGTPVTSSDVVAGWSVAAGGVELKPEVRRLVQSVTAPDGRSLAITLRSPAGDAPIALAHADLAVARPVSGSPWPAGTRGVRVGLELPPTALAGATMIPLVRAAPATPASPDAAPFVTFIVAPGRDRRDLLDTGADLLLTRDPAALRYAATLASYRLVPLPWERTRVFAARGPRGAALGADARGSLAADAVRGEARGAEEPFWWQTVTGCEAPPPPSPPPAASTGRVVYDAGDAAARDLAERLVAIAVAPRAATAPILAALWPDRTSGAARRATGLTGGALESARRRGGDAGYILALARTPLDACAELRRATEAMAWLTADGIVPLVDTRLQAVVRHGRARLIVQGDGGLLLASPDGAGRQ